MNVLFFINPSECHGIPLNAARGMVGKLPEMVAGLRRAGCNVDLLSSAAAADHMRRERPGAFEGISKTYLLDGKGLDRFVTAPDGTATLTQINPDTASVEQAMGALRDLGCTSAYDVVISPFTETAFLKALFPKSKVLFFETGLVCHLPFHQFHVLDPYGTYRSGAYFSRLKDTDIGPEVEDYAPVLDRLNEVLRTFSRSFVEEAGGRRRLRGNFARVVLLPLQVTDNPSFRDSVPYGSQFALLEHVLRKLPRDVGLLVSEHPSYPQITAMQHGYLSETYPNYIYYPRLQSLWSPSGVLLPIVDAVIGVSSTVLLQAHALGLRTFALGTGAFAALNQNPDLDDFLASLEESRAFATPRRQILDMLARYSVPQTVYQSADIGRYIKAMLDTPPNATRLPIIADPDALIQSYDRKPWPKTLVKTTGFYAKGWTAAPLALSGGKPFAVQDAPAPVVAKPTTTVAVLLDHFGVGGTPRVLQRLIDRMPEVRWLVLVERRIAEEFPAPANCDIIEFKTCKTPDETAREIASTLFRLNRDCPIDVFINPMHWRPAALKAMPLVKEQLQIPTVYWEHNSFYFPFFIANPSLHATRKECLPAADRTILLGDHDRALFQSTFPEAPTQIIRNPVPSFEVEPTPEALREKVILVVGRFDPQKRMDRAVPVMKAFRDRCPDWRMVILGDGYLRPEIEARIKAEGLSDVIDLVGYDDQPEKYYAQAGIVAILSDFEAGPGPLTLMEAKAYSVPVAMFELFQNTRLTHGVDGLIAEQGNYAQFADNLAELAQDADLRSRMGQAGLADFLVARDHRPEEDWRQLFADLKAGLPGETLADPTLPPRAVAEAVHVLETLHYLLDDRAQKRAKQVAAPAAGAAQPKDVQALRTKVAQLQKHIDADAKLIQDRFQAIRSMDDMIKSRDAHITADAQLLEARLTSINDLAARLHDADRRLPWIVRKIWGTSARKR